MDNFQATSSFDKVAFLTEFSCNKLGQIGLSQMNIFDKGNPKIKASLYFSHVTLARLYSIPLGGS